MTALPDDILREAHLVRDQLCIECECRFDNGCGCLEAIQSALFVERTRTQKETARRCVELVESHMPATQDMTSTFICDALVGIAQAIATEFPEVKEG